MNRTNDFSALVALATLWALALCGADRCWASGMIIQLCPSNIVDTPITVRVQDARFGSHFTVFYQTNGYTLDELLHATLEVNGEDKRISSCAAEKNWTTNGVEFSFRVATNWLEASKFTILEMAHDGRNHPMPGFTAYWFYLRDFGTNAPPISRGSGNVVPPDLIQKLPQRVRALHPGLTADQVWEALGLSAYRNRLGGESYPTKERHQLNWNHELELRYEELSGLQSYLPPDRRKLFRATLFKNGRAIATSGQ
jgi:hypothetical protein